MLCSSRSPVRVFGPLRRRWRGLQVTNGTDASPSHSQRHSLHCRCCVLYAGFVQPHSEPLAPVCPASAAHPQYQYFPPTSSDTFLIKGQLALWPIYENRLTRRTLVSLLCGHSKDGEHFSHDLHSHVCHCGRRRGLNFGLETLVRVFDALKEHDESVLLTPTA